jgi:hypothetical protein
MDRAQSHNSTFTPQPPGQTQTKRAPPAPAPSSSPQKKRKRSGAAVPLPSSSSSLHLKNEFLSVPVADEGATLGSLDFHEILDEDALRHRTTVVNRAPVMMAWACVVAERLGFSREEALSICTPSQFLRPPPSYSPLFSLSSIGKYNTSPCSIGVHRNECGLQRRLIGHLRQETRG